MHYFKFFLFHIYALTGIAAFIAGGPWITIAFAGTTLSIILGDLHLGDDTSTPDIRHSWPYNLQLWLALPLLSGLMLAGLYRFGSFVTPAEEYSLVNWLNKAATRQKWQR